MIWVIVVLAAMIIFWMVDKPRRAHRNAHRKRHIHLRETDERLTYTDLANKRHNLRTARNMIKLGLVRQGLDINEQHLYLIFDGVPPQTSARSMKLARQYGLLPGEPGFVGF